MSDYTKKKSWPSTMHVELGEQPVINFDPPHPLASIITPYICQKKLSSLGQREVLFSEMRLDTERGFKKEMMGNKNDNKKRG